MIARASTHGDKTAAIRAVLKAARKPIDFPTLHQGVEERLKRIVGRQKLKTLLSVMKAVNKEIVTDGWGDERTYAIAGRRG